MINQILNPLISSYSQLKNGLTLGVGLATFTMFPLLAAPVPTIDFQKQPVATNSASSASISSTKSSTLLDGTYLYGESSIPEEIGQEYLVFRVKNGNVMGAFYMPRSEFSCFSGSVEGDSLNLAIVDPYEETVYSHRIALSPVPSSPIASANGQVASMELNGYERISHVSENDQKILSICQSYFAQ
ncbi:MAG: hypothetical protein ACOC0N_12890 [Chroococcales cyanobacterium]